MLNKKKSCLRKKKKRLDSPQQVGEAGDGSEGGMIGGHDERAQGGVFDQQCLQPTRRAAGVWGKEHAERTSEKEHVFRTCRKNIRLHAALLVSGRKPFILQSLHLISNYRSYNMLTCPD